MTINPNSLANLNRKGRIPGSRSKIRFNDVITDERLRNVINEIYRIALEGRYEKDRLSAASLILDRALGKVAVEVHQTITDSSTLQDLLQDEPTEPTEPTEPDDDGE